MNRKWQIALGAALFLHGFAAAILLVCFYIGVPWAESEVTPWDYATPISGLFSVLICPAFYLYIWRNWPNPKSHAL
jgi:hypothetical protein